MRNLALSLLASIIVFTISIAQQPAKQKAPNFSLQTADGNMIELAKLKGKVVVVNFWATWCGPCRKEMPDFVEIYKQKKSNGLEIVSIALDKEGWKVVTPFVKKYGINFPVVVGNTDLADAYGGLEYIPTTFLVDRNGMIVDKHIGMMPKQVLEQKLQPLLKDLERIQ